MKTGRFRNIPEVRIVRNCRMKLPMRSSYNSEVTRHCNVWVENLQLQLDLYYLYQIECRYRGGEVENFVRSFVGECKESILGIEMKYLGE